MLTSRLYGGMPCTYSPLMRMNALVGLLETGQHSQRGGLATAARAEQRQELAGDDLEVDAVDGDHGAVALHQLASVARSLVRHSRRGVPSLPDRPARC